MGYKSSNRWANSLGRLDKFLCGLPCLDHQKSEQRDLVGQAGCWEVCTFCVDSIGSVHWTAHPADHNSVGIHQEAKPFESPQNYQVGICGKCYGFGLFTKKTILSLIHWCNGNVTFWVSTIFIYVFFLCIPIFHVFAVPITMWKSHNFLQRRSLRKDSWRKRWAE